MRKGDIIMSLDNEKIKDSEHFLAVAKALEKGKAIPVLVQRGQSALFLAVRIEKTDK